MVKKMPEDANNDSALEKWRDFKADGRPVGEHILNILKAVLSVTPFASAIASLMTDYIPSARSQRLEQFAEQIAEDLLHLQDRVDANYLQTDEFAFMFEKCFRAVAENPQRDKLEAFRGILVNSAIRKDLTGGEKEYFLNLALNLTTLHIRILRFMATPESYLAAAGIPHASIQGGFSHFFPIALPGVQLDVIRSAFDELFRYGLINTDKSIFGTMTAGQGLDLLKGRVSEFGQRFITFCAVPE
jgi:hypothetical protein